MLFAYANVTPTWRPRFRQQRLNDQKLCYPDPDEDC